MDEAIADYNRSVKNAKKKAKSNGDDDDPAAVKEPRMKEGEMKNFLKLCAALTIMLRRTIYRDQIDTAKTLLTEYLLGFRKVNERHIESTLRQR